MEPSKQIADYIAAAPGDQAVFMEKIREIIRQAVPNVEENFKWGRPVFSATKDFAYFKSAKAYLTVGFFNFHNLKDPDNLLEGTGKDMRHIKIKKAGDINETLLREWFAATAK